MTHDEWKKKLNDQKRGSYATETKLFENMANGQHAEATDEDVRELLRAIENYHEMALYFADVLAASASQTLMLKSTSKSERKRQLDIAKMVREALVSEHTPYRGCYCKRFDVLERLDEIVEEYEPKTAAVLKRICEACGHEYEVKPTVDLGNGGGIYSSDTSWCPKCGGAARAR